MLSIILIKGVATLRYAKVSNLKVQRLLKQINKRSSTEALLILKFLKQKAAVLIFQVISSAVSNANFSNKGLNLPLFITEARVDVAPKLKRFSARAQGRSYPITKHVSHIINVYIICSFIILNFRNKVYIFFVFMINLL